MKKWLTQVWRLTSPRCAVGLGKAGDPREPMVWIPAGGQEEMTWDDPARQWGRKMGNSSFLRLLFYSSPPLIGRSPRTWGGGHLPSPRAQTLIFSYNFEALVHGGKLNDFIQSLLLPKSEVWTKWNLILLCSTSYQTLGFIFLLIMMGI